MDYVQSERPGETPKAVGRGEKGAQPGPVIELMRMPGQDKDVAIFD
jgi:hypothetical protein